MAQTFTHYVGIDYSGARTPECSLNGLRLYTATLRNPPRERHPPPGPRKYWTRRGLAEWLQSHLDDCEPTLVGIDHAFSFPARYFETNRLEPNWDVFLDDFQRHWPTHEPHTSVERVRDGSAGSGHLRQGNTRWRRVTEIRAGGAKSVFHFDVPGSVAKSTHAGLPWLRTLRRALGERAHFWPFDGWEIPADRSVIAEVYPRLFSHAFSREERTPDQHDAYSIAAWFQQMDTDGRLAGYARPPLRERDEAVAREMEGWILGVM